MERTTPLSGSSGSLELTPELESLDHASFECLEMLEQERVISGNLIAESEVLIARVVKALDDTPTERLSLRQAGVLKRYRAHLTALRAYTTGAFYMDTRES